MTKRPQALALFERHGLEHFFCFLLTFLQLMSERRKILVDRSHPVAFAWVIYENNTLSVEMSDQRPHVGGVLDPVL